MSDNLIPHFEHMKQKYLNNSNTKQINVEGNFIKFHQLKLLIHILKSLNDNEISSPTDKSILKKAMNQLWASDHIKLENSGYTTLGLQISYNLELPHTVSTFIKKYLIEEIFKICTPIINVHKKMKEECRMDLQENQIFELEQKRKELTMKYLELKIKKITILHHCMQLKTGTGGLENKLKILLDEYKLGQAKVNTLYSIINYDLPNRTDFAPKAIKEIVESINKTLQAKNKNIIVRTFSKS